MKKKISVLVVDDSVIFREMMVRNISGEQDMYVIARAGDPYEARDKILEYNPDVMICDVEMPKMNGIEFIKRLLPQHPMPVIVISGYSELVFDAMNAGAVEFVAKPNIKSSATVLEFTNELKSKVRIAAASKVETGKTAEEREVVNIIKHSQMKFSQDKIIAIGASTGGTEALFNLLSSLPENIPGIAIVQHIPPIFSRMFSERLDKQTVLNVKEAETGDIMMPGRVLVAPGDKHMILKKKGGKYAAEVFDSAKVNGHCPSVDVLFDSVAKEAGEEAVGIILTGMGYDGAKGLMAMKRKGAKTIGQDEKSCVVYGMPKAAYELGAVDKQVPLGKIPETLYPLLY